MHFKTYYQYLAQFILSLLFCFITPKRSLAETLILPQLKGHYSVRTKSIEIIDTSRKGVRDSNDKKWMVSIFYPTLPT